MRILVILFFPQFLLASLPDFVSLYKKVNPAVVNISTQSLPRLPQRPPGAYRDPFYELFEHFYGQRTPQPQKGLGTGFIIEANGLIITNNHVIQGADQIEVQLSDESKKTYKAEVIGTDPKTDIALIKIKIKKKLPTIPLGSSEKLLPGEWVAAFGNPLGLGHTITKGIISAKGREVEELGIFPFLQTDASINPGNSGGPLVNLKGEVIGVNTFIIRGAQGLGFAVPIDGVKQILPDLKSKGRVTRGYIGISFMPLNPRAVKALGLKDDKGMMIVNVDENSSAAKSGLKAYDIILEVNDSEITSSRSLQNAVAQIPVGQKMKIKILRDGKKKTYTLAVGKAPEEKTMVGRKHNQKQERRGIEANYGLGFRVTTLTKELAAELDINFTRRPVVISVTPSSPASFSGLKQGDIILDVNRRRIRTATQINKVLKRGTNLIRILRGETTQALFMDSK